MRRLFVNGNSKTLLLILSLAFNFGVCVALAVQRHGEQDPKPGFHDKEPRRGRLSSKLNLSPEQTAIVDSSRDKLFEELRALRSETHNESEILAELLIAPEPDMDAISAQLEKLANVRNQIQWRMIEHFLGIRELLEPEQLDPFKEFISRGLSRHGLGGRFGERWRDHGDRRPRHFHRDGRHRGFGQDTADEEKTDD